MDDRSLLGRVNLYCMYKFIYVKRTAILPFFPQRHPKHKVCFPVAYGSFWRKVPYPGLHVHLHHQEISYSAVKALASWEEAYVYKASISVTVATLSTSTQVAGDLTDSLWVYRFVYLISSWFMSILSHMPSTYAFPRHPYFNNADPLHTQWSGQKLKQLPPQCPSSALYCQEAALHILQRRNVYVNFGYSPQTVYGWTNRERTDCTLLSGTGLSPQRGQESPQLLW